MKGLAVKYTDEELRWIRANCKLARRELHAAFIKKFNRDDVTIDHIKALCSRRKWKTGRTGQFPKGNIPENKGKKGFCAPGSEKGWFKPGERRGVAEALYKPIGTERITKDGYIERKIHDGMPLQSRWRAVHLVRWEEIHGPLPKGHALKCLDGDKSNTDPSNWECVPRALLPRLNGRFGRNYDAAPAELQPTILKVTKLEHQARELRKRNK